MATRQSSRALTIVAALERLDLLANPPSDGHLIIHILGADTREGSSFSQTAAVFLPLCERLRDSSIYTVDLLLCGPNCASATASQSRPADAGPLLSVQYSSLTYEVWRKQYADAMKRSSIYTHRKPSSLLIHNNFIGHYFVGFCVISYK